MRRASTKAQTITSGGEDEAHIHVPSPSYWPLFTSLGLPIIAYGMIYKTCPTMSQPRGTGAPPH